MSTSKTKQLECPIKIPTTQIINQIHDMVMGDRRLNICEIAANVGISSKRARNISQLKKLSARRVMRLLNVDQKQDQRVTNVAPKFTGLAFSSHNWGRNIDTLLHAYGPRKFKKWVDSGESVPEKTNTVPSAAKIIATVFWDYRGIIFVDCLV